MPAAHAVRLRQPGGLSPALPVSLFRPLRLYLNLNLSLSCLARDHRLLHLSESWRVETQEVDSGRKNAGRDPGFVAARRTSASERDLTSLPPASSRACR